jgi:CRISPR-associated endoribonuclease Cas6
VNGQCSISLSYSYYLSTAIYKWIETSSPEYSAFLHNPGFQVEGTEKRFRHFCFSQLRVPRSKVIDGRLHILSPTLYWDVTMPVDASLEHLVIGMFEKRQFYIEREENQFVVEHLKHMPPPQWHRRMKFSLLSPVVVTTMKEYDGKLQTHYVLPDDPRLSDLLRANIINKYVSLYDEEPEDTTFVCILDQEYIARKTAEGKRITTLITIKEGRTEEARVRGFMCPFMLEGNPELIRLAYESVLSEQNAMRFGMMEVIKTV